MLCVYERRYSLCSCHYSIGYSTSHITLTLYWVILGEQYMRMCVGSILCKYSAMLYKGCAETWVLVTMADHGTLPWGSWGLSVFQDNWHSDCFFTISPCGSLLKNPPPPRAKELTRAWNRAAWTRNAWEWVGPSHRVSDRVSPYGLHLLFAPLHMSGMFLFSTACFHPRLRLLGASLTGTL